MLFRRRLLGALSVFSLVLGGITVVLWVRSYWVADRLTIQRAHYRQARGDEEDAEMSPYRGKIVIYAIQINRGSILVHTERSVELLLGPENLRDWKEYWPEGSLAMWNRDEAAPTPVHFDVFNVVNEFDDLDRFGFFFGTADRNGISSFVNFHMTEASVPAWFVMTVFATPFAIRLVRLFRSRRRNAAGLCPACGYDLRGTPGRCPECNWREAGANAK